MLHFEYVFMLHLKLTEILVSVQEIACDNEYSYAYVLQKMDLKEIGCEDVIGFIWFRIGTSGSI
jgi:hypothetical protein